MYCIKVMNENGCTQALERGEEEISLVYTAEYHEGDQILIETSGESDFLWIQLDDALGESLNYLKGDYEYHIPFGEMRNNLSPKTFSGNKHLIHLKKAKDYEIASYRNLAFNVNDSHENSSCYPHASANVETRGESVFAAKNAIDGITANTSHGTWPYASWGINRDPKAALTLDFGREVEIDCITLCLRADFPHDNWWKRAKITFSDDSSMNIDLQKTASEQEFHFEKKKISCLKLQDLIPSDNPSPFPALTQIEVYGKDSI
jgi:hypothetical protein